VRRILRAFPASEAVAFFREIGVSLHEEAGGKLFPDSNRSRDVLDALLRETARVGATLESGRRVLDVARAKSSPGNFMVTTSTGDVAATAVVLATGGKSLPKTGSDGAGFDIARRLGHTIVEPTPALAPLLLTGDDFHRELSGVSQDVELAIWIDGRVESRLRGAMLWTHFGVSGPVALDASRHWHRAQIDRRTVAITVNFCPGARFDDVDADWTRQDPGTSAGVGADRARDDDPRVRCRGASPPPRNRWRRGACAFFARRQASSGARARGMAAAGRRLTRLQLRRGDRRRRGAHRGRSLDDGGRGSVRDCTWWEKCSTSTAGSAASTSSGRGRPGTSPAAASPRFDTSRSQVLRSPSCHGRSSSGDSSPPSRSSTTRSAASSAR
jgi:hypothetical protein